MKKTVAQLKKAWKNALDEHDNWDKVYFLLQKAMDESSQKVEYAAKGYFKAMKKKG